MFTHYLSLELQRLPHCLTKEVTIFFRCSWQLLDFIMIQRIWLLRISGRAINGTPQGKKFERSWKYIIIISIFLSIGTFQDRKFLDKCWICGVWVSSRGQEDNDVSSGKVKSEEAQFLLWKEMSFYIWRPKCIIQLWYKYTLIFKWRSIA